jgi:hypothetical protein
MRTQFTPDSEFIVPCVESLGRHFRDAGIEIEDQNGCDFIVRTNGPLGNHPEYVGWIKRQLD